MFMTDEQRYSAVLKELGEVLASKNATISCQRWQIDELKTKLEVAEAECVKAEAERDRWHNHYEAAAAELRAVNDEIEVLKGGAA